MFKYCKLYFSEAHYYLTNKNKIMYWFKTVRVLAIVCCKNPQTQRRTQSSFTVIALVRKKSSTCTTAR